MKGLFIPGITVEMFRNGSLESIEELMTEGEIYDIEYSKWNPVSEKLPKDRENILFSTKAGIVFEGRFFDDKTNLQWYEYRYKQFEPNRDVTAWKPLPKPYKAGEKE